MMGCHHGNCDHQRRGGRAGGGREERDQQFLLSRRSKTLQLQVLQITESKMIKTELMHEVKTRVKNSSNADEIKPRLFL